MRSTISACRATIAAAARCCGSKPPSTPSRRRGCARSAVPRPTCMTARSRRSPTWSGITRAASSSGRRFSKDLTRGLKLTDAERADLIAFLGTLTSDGSAALARPDRAGRKPARRCRPSRSAPCRRTTRRSIPTISRLPRGGRLWIVNNDTRTHNVRVFDPALDFDSGAQEPGETVEITFPRTGVPGVLRHPSQDGALRRCRARK